MLRAAIQIRNNMEGGCDGPIQFISISLCATAETAKQLSVASIFKNALLKTKTLIKLERLRLAVMQRAQSLQRLKLGVSTLENSEKNDRANFS
jgi:hypothetical protein